ncbi:MAG: mechanosensitive ion channel family protein [Alphaproteobacteria bacterium]
METGLKEQFDAFWDLAVQVWNTGVMGADLGSLVLAVLILIVFWVMRRVFSIWVLGFVRQFTESTETDVDDTILKALEGPLKFMFIVLGIFSASQVLPLHAEIDQRAQQLVSSLLLVVFFWGLYNAAGPIIGTMSTRISFLKGAIADWFERGLKLIVVLLGIAGILESFGIPVAPIIGGLGLFGVAVALGAQDLFRNLIAGALILTERRFRKGDWIRVDGIVEGTVENIGFRSTKVRRFDKAPVQVPNTALSDNPVTNFSLMTYRRIYWTIGVTYDTSVDQLRRIRDELDTYIKTSKDFAPPMAASAFVRIDAFSDSSIDIMLYCFTRTTAWGEWLEVKERLAFKVMEIIAGAQARFAFPSQSLYVETWAGEGPERFVPPAPAPAPDQKSTATGKETASRAKPSKAAPKPAPA